MSESSGAWKFFVAFAIVACIVIGFYALQSKQAQDRIEENRYNGYDFALASNNVWVTRIQLGTQPYNVPFHYHPRETEDVIVYEQVKELLLDDNPSHVFIVFAPDAGAIPVIGGVEIAKITGQKYDILNIPTSSALSSPAEETPIDLPIITCSEPETIPEGTAVVQFVQGTENAIIRDGQCVILFYIEPEDSIRVADRYAFMLLGIMN